jgi:RNA polymerase sigma-70 factor (ECF subfamily)
MSLNDSASSTVIHLAILGKLFEEHRPKLVEMARRRIDPALAARIDPEAVVNDAYLVAQAKCPGFEERSVASTYAWLYRIVRDCLIEAWRRETRECRDGRKDMPLPEQSSLQLGLGLVSPATDPQRAAERDEEREILRLRMRQVLDVLREADREILWMRHYDNLTFPEAAAVLEITENAATVRYVRALKRLKDLWQQLFPNAGPES